MFVLRSAEEFGERELLRAVRFPLRARKTGRRVGRQAAVIMTSASTEVMISRGVVTSVASQGVE